MLSNFVVKSGKIGAPPFHLSIGVKAIDESIRFFGDALGATVSHRDPDGKYVNIEVLGHQITLKPAPDIRPNLPDFHFGFNLNTVEFEKIVDRIQKHFPQWIAKDRHKVDASQDLERDKIYLISPTGYLIELKWFKNLP